MKLVSKGGIKIRGQGGILWRLLPVVRVVFQSIGRDWNKFYGWMLDRQERKNSIDKLLSRRFLAQGRDKGLYDFSRGDYHVDYLKRHGLKPQHDFLDIGCGLGRTAVPLLRYLEPMRYVGLDLSKERIRIAVEYIALEKLEHAKPTFIANQDNDIARATGRTFDFIWAQSVFTHMPPAMARDLLVNVRKVMKINGTFLFNFARGLRDGESRSVKDFCYTIAFFENAAREIGFKMRIHDNWQDDLPLENRAAQMVMVEYTF